MFIAQRIFFWISKVMRFGAGKKKIMILTLALLTIVSSACAQLQMREEKMKQAQQHAERAIELREKGDYQGAIREQLKAIKLNENDDAKMWVNLTRFYLDAKEFETAKETAQHAIELDPKDALAHYLYSEAFERLGNDDNNALKHRKIAVELDTNNVLFRVNLGSIQQVVGDNKAARESYLKALELAPDDISAMYYLGRLEAEEENLEKAIEWLERAVRAPESQPDDYVFIEDAQEELNKVKSRLQKTKP